MIFYEHNYANIKLVLRGAKKGGILQWGWAEFRDPQKNYNKTKTKSIFIFFTAKSTQLNEKLLLFLF
jgi:hypothetical protein